MAKKAQAQVQSRPSAWSFVSSRAFLCLVCLFILTILALSSLWRPIAGQNAPAQNGSHEPAQAATVSSPPVILLTGFESFGETRSPNPSWEAIKELDGQKWKGFLLVAKQSQMVWGAPLKQMQDWLAQYHPVAVFAFGQGKTGAFSLETRASNERGPGVDNLGARPANPNIVDSGPKRITATADCDKYSRSLAGKGYLTRISSEAGRSLCEEMLYSLEYLKSTQNLKGTVLFCHVPQLGTNSKDTKVTAEYVRQFVMDMLETWYTTDGGAKLEARYQEVKAMIERYFKTWSDQDMDGYEACFMPSASVQMLEGPGGLTTLALPRFIASQREYHRTSPIKTVEVPLSIDIRFEEKLARVVVYWKLTCGARIEKGYDHFTLTRNNNDWKIVNLVFYTE